jgi:2-polyprenyl-6-methoxyphenol hydroxylase-like FAD-dependent oxidoreductase
MSDSTTVAISGGGPAGVMLGLLLARQGVDVTVLEKHGDFLRDFRGDTVHPSTQLILQQLGLLEEFERIVHGRMAALDFGTTEGPLVHAELADVHPRHRFHEIALAPQWDLLDLLVRHAQQYPSFSLLMEAETTDALAAAGAVRGIRYRQGGVEHELRAVLTVDAEGRGSGLREAVGGDLVRFGAPIDVLWFRLPRRPDDTGGLRGLLGHGGAIVAIDRQDYWQIAFIVAKGSADAVRSAGLPAFRERIARLAPWLADRVGELTDWDQVKLLSVTVERLRRWYARGILAIGDAAHTMSPVGGVGINLAIADAVATANLLGPRLLEAQHDPDRFSKVLNPALLRQVQRRRLPTVAVTQRVQVLAQDRIIALLRTPEGDPLSPPAPVRALLQGVGARVAPRLFAYGLRPERVALGPHEVDGGRVTAPAA